MSVESLWIIEFKLFERNFWIVTDTLGDKQDAERLLKTRKTLNPQGEYRIVEYVRKEPV